MITTFAVLFALFTRPWKVADPRSRAAVGIGALNLVRRSAYERAGGHGEIRLRVDDDLALGQLLKARGGRPEFCYARDAASVEWYPGVVAMIRGLEKNAFAGVGFRLWFVPLATAALLGLFVAPWLLAAAPWVTGAELPPPAPRSMPRRARGVGRGSPRWTGLLFPAGILLFLVILWRSTLVTLFTGGLRWRGMAIHWTFCGARVAEGGPPTLRLAQPRWAMVVGARGGPSGEALPHDGELARRSQVTTSAADDGHGEQARVAVPQDPEHGQVREDRAGQEPDRQRAAEDG